MKNKLYINLLLLFTLLFLASCKDYFVTTKINSDGTCERTIIVKLDKASADDSLKNWQKHAGWDVSMKYDESSKKYCYTGIKKYASFKEMEEDSKNEIMGFKPVCELKVEKYFRLFFTYYSYNETYKAYKTDNLIPIDRYFTSDEIIKLKAMNDSAWVNQKLQEFEKVNLYEMLVRGFSNYIMDKEKVDIPGILPDNIKSSMYKELIAAKDEKKLLFEIIEKYLGSSLAHKFWNFAAKDEGIKKTSDSYEQQEYEGGYNNSIILPGIITASNSKNVEGNKVSWKFDQYNFKYFDYTMTAESREVNLWVIITAGIIVLVLAGGLFFSRFRAKKAI